MKFQAHLKGGSECEGHTPLHSIIISIKWACGYGLTRRTVAEHPASITASRLSLPPFPSVGSTGCNQRTKERRIFKPKRKREKQKKGGWPCTPGRLVPTFKAEVLNKALSLRPHSHCRSQESRVKSQVWPARTPETSLLLEALEALEAN